MLSNIIFPKTYTIFGFEIGYYLTFFVVGFLGIFIFNTFYGKKFNIKPAKGLLLSVSSYLLIFVWAYILAWVESLFSDWGHHNVVRVYIWMPLLLFLLAKPMKLKWKACVDFIAPSTCLVFGFVKFGCMFPGCCYGIPCDWGIYSHEAGYNCFPVQFCEAVTALILAAITLIMNKKKNYVGDSRTYFIMLIPYGLTRFVWEFFRGNEKLLLNISSLALHALLMSVVGAIMLVVLHYADKKKTAQLQPQ